MLPLSFYARDAETVARKLLGKTLVVKQSGVEHRAGLRRAPPRRVRIVETEAYVGEHDLACHASKGRTKRTEVMFGPAGHAYVYLIYGMYDMLNIVTGDDGVAQAVLIRAAEPLTKGIEKTDGPGKLTRALDITTSRHNGLSLVKPPLFLEDGEPPTRIAVTPRIGVDYAGEWKDAPLRFVDAKSEWVSRKL